MNTAVEYRRPTHRNKYGQYKSLTLIANKSFVGHISISLVWFSGLGWYFSIELSGTTDLKDIIIDGMSSDYIWRKGKEVSKCAQEAELKAKEMLKENKVMNVEFAPYTVR